MELLTNFVTNYYYFIALLVCFIILPKHTFLYRYSIAVLFSLDCLLNTAILFGDHREAVSSRIGKAHLRGVVWILPFMCIINFIFWPIEGDLNHCVNAIQHDVGDKTLWHWK